MGGPTKVVMLLVTNTKHRQRKQQLGLGGGGSNFPKGRCHPSLMYVQRSPFVEMPMGSGIPTGPSQGEGPIRVVGPISQPHDTINTASLTLDHTYALNVRFLTQLFFILLTHEGSHREAYRDFQPSLTSSAGSAKGCSDHRFRTPAAYTAQLPTLHQHRANNQYRTANQI